MEVLNKCRIKKSGILNWFSIIPYLQMRPRGHVFGVFPKKIRNTTIFYFWVYDEKGKRKFRSTGKKTFDEAVNYCRNLQVKGLLHAEISFSSFTKKFFDYDHCPYINHRLSRGHSYSRSWAKRQKRLLDTIIKPHFNNKSINSITFNDIDNFIISLKHQNFSNKKINHIIVTMKNIFKFAELNGNIHLNPTKGLKPFKVVSPEKGILTKEEINILFNEETRSQIWPKKMNFVINYLAASTGLRLGEILALKPKDLSGNRLIISNSFSPEDGLKSTKNGKTRVIPLNEKLNGILNDYCKGKQKDAFLFSVNNGIKPVNHKSVYKHFWKALEKIGINKEERERRNISFHSHRHYANTALLQAGYPPETVRLLLGHSGQAMTAHYSHVELPDILSMQIDSGRKSTITETSSIEYPKFVDALFDKGFLFPDRKRVVHSLNEVALQMKKMNIRPTAMYLSEVFLKTDGSKYTFKACKEAVAYANNPANR